MSELYALHYSRSILALHVCQIASCAWVHLLLSLNSLSRLPRLLVSSHVRNEFRPHLPTAPERCSRCANMIMGTTGSQACSRWSKKMLTVCTPSFFILISSEKMFRCSVDESCVGPLLDPCHYPPPRHQPLEIDQPPTDVQEPPVRPVDACLKFNCWPSIDFCSFVSYRDPSVA